MRTTDITELHFIASGLRVLLENVSPRESGVLRYCGLPMLYCKTPLARKRHLEWRNKPNRIGFYVIMPTVTRIDGLRVVVYPNDHRPAHVHVIGNDSEAVFDLNCPVGPPEVRENYGFSLKALGKVKAELAKDLDFLCAEWSRIHGSQ